MHDTEGAMLQNDLEATRTNAYLDGLKNGVLAELGEILGHRLLWTGDGKIYLEGMAGKVPFNAAMSA